MGLLFDTIRSRIDDGRVVVGIHAAARLDMRNIDEWQVIAGFGEGTLLSERPRTLPHPSIEVDQTLPDGTSIKAVWSLLKSPDAAKLVTVHFYDDDDAA